MKNGQSKRLDKLQEHKALLERNDIIRELPTFESLSRSEIEKRIDIWTEYYRRVAQGGAAKLYRANRSALQSGVMLTVIENGQRAKKALEAHWQQEHQEIQEQKREKVQKEEIVFDERWIAIQNLKDDYPYLESILQE